MALGLAFVRLRYTHHARYILFCDFSDSQYYGQGCGTCLACDIFTQNLNRTSDPWVHSIIVCPYNRAFRCHRISTKSRSFSNIMALSKPVYPAPISSFSYNLDYAYRSYISYSANNDNGNAPQETPEIARSDRTNLLNLLLESEIVRRVKNPLFLALKLAENNCAYSSAFSKYSSILY
ncbi:uncharacterized protein BDR25DRAFT_357239 [Lindgomyces ingoldianus]|uniref:Uncharacterized protein n=1 Tax=Lindgomyces ingoldianus TaxID=673940 RepID=A0ACB6QRG0_9PLEO|nr:uncharacterized protein BDR25DRAFT_357239 [Lindgomyces ingoldianus]KAF2468882.1 hypothetical protein BDR25DRAFT_357239 [Lindgomyces ingoldianus]